MGPGSAAHRHSASKTHVNALMALRSIRGTLCVSDSIFKPQRQFVAEQSLRANGSRECAPMTGSAKQSIKPRKERWIASLRSQ
jgi:hypothetical protein